MAQVWQTCRVGLGWVWCEGVVWRTCGPVFVSLASPLVNPSVENNPPNCTPPDSNPPTPGSISHPPSSTPTPSRSLCSCRNAERAEAYIASLTIADSVSISGRMRPSDGMRALTKEGVCMGMRQGAVELEGGAVEKATCRGRGMRCDAIRCDPMRCDAIGCNPAHPIQMARLQAGSECSSTPSFWLLSGPAAPKFRLVSYRLLVRQSKTS